MEGYGKALRIKKKAGEPDLRTPGDTVNSRDWDHFRWEYFHYDEFAQNLFLPFFMPLKSGMEDFNCVSQVLCLPFAQSRRGHFAWSSYLEHWGFLVWGESVMREAGSWVRTETFRCMPCIGNILVLGGPTGAHFVTYVDVMLLFCMYQIFFENNNKP